MTALKKVAVFGVIALGRFRGQQHLLTWSRALATLGRPSQQRSYVPDSTTTHAPETSVIRTGHTVQELTKALAGQDAAVCVVSPGGMKHQIAMIDAAEAAGVQRFILDDFGWGPDLRGLPEFDAIMAERRGGCDHAKARAEANANFTWTGASTGNPIDRVNCVRVVCGLCM